MYSPKEMWTIIRGAKKVHGAICAVIALAGAYVALTGIEVIGGLIAFLVCGFLAYKLFTTPSLVTDEDREQFDK